MAKDGFVGHSDSDASTEIAAPTRLNSSKKQPNDQMQNCGAAAQSKMRPSGSHEIAQ